MNVSTDDWLKVQNAADVTSPSLLIYPQRIERNIRQMAEMVSRPELLRPHVKTHKMPEVIRLSQRQGIQKYKCATIAEAEMLGELEVADVLLAYQPVGPNVVRLRQLFQKFPRTHFSTVVDDLRAAQVLSGAFSKTPLGVWIDVDCGMHRTGLAPARVAEFFRELQNLPGLRVLGLHCYDGHIHEPDPAVRRKQYQTAFEPVMQLRSIEGLPRALVAGGTPTFPFHAESGEVECSPGTPVLWDAGYRDKFKDLPFEVAASLLVRVIGKPGANRLCLDLGNKAVASENPHPRVFFPQLGPVETIMHSEEHLVVETSRAGEFAVGDVLYGIPRHICPTCALYSEAVVVRDGRAQDVWKITARARRLTI